MEEAIAKPVSLPRPNPTISYWQDPPADIALLRSTTDLPKDADIVIIGSGITGARIAYNILSQDSSKQVIMLEAREVCSGATGRNGGHTKAASYRSFIYNAETLGVQEAVKVARLEYNNIKEVHAFAKEHNIDCDFFPCNTADIFYDKKSRENAETAIKMMREVMDEDLNGAAQYTFHTPEEAYKLVIGILKLCLHYNLSIQTNTPALQLNRDETINLWTVTTSRGSIKTPNVILATNGYTTALYPPLQSIIIPLRGQITAQRPGFSLPYALPTTYSFIYDSGFEYMIQRPPGTKYAGDIVIGGGLTRGRNEYGNTDDTTLDKNISMYLKETTEGRFGKAWGSDDKQGRVRREWSGIMGFSGDGMPWVGQLPGEKGLWIFAAFQGHGMVLCWKCAKAMTNMWMDKEEGLMEWFPEA